MIYLSVPHPVFTIQGRAEDYPLGGRGVQDNFWRQNIMASAWVKPSRIAFWTDLQQWIGLPRDICGLESLMFSSCSGLIRWGGESGGILPRENFEIWGPRCGKILYSGRVFNWWIMYTLLYVRPLFSWGILANSLVIRPFWAPVKMHSE